jgi:serine/threonine protein phosphatase 1
MAKTFVIGDIHGAHKALLQCLERSGFNKDEDNLICLGDVCDGWPETKESINTLMSIRQLIYIMGNHDYWALEWMRGEFPGEIWSVQGGDATVRSYNGLPNDSHKAFLENSSLYHLIDNTLFVHAGVQPEIDLNDQSSNTFLWDRKLATSALELRTAKAEKQLTSFDEIYLGHTPIHAYGYNHPIKACEIWFMDTGAGWNGCLSMMDINSKDFFTSDPVPSLYPEDKGRF